MKKFQSRYKNKKYSREKANDSVVTYDYTTVYKIKDDPQSYSGLVIKEDEKDRKKLWIFTKKDKDPRKGGYFWKDVQYTLNDKLPLQPLSNVVAFFTVFLQNEKPISAQSDKTITLEALSMIAKTFKSVTKSQRIVLYDAANNIIFQDGTAPIKPIDPPVKPVDPVKPIEPVKPVEPPVPVTSFPLVYKIKANSTSYSGLYMDQKAWIVKQNGDSDSRKGYRYYIVEYSINDQPRILLSKAIDLYSLYENKERLLAWDNNQMVTMDALKIIASTLKAQNKSNTKIAFYESNSMIFSIVDEPPKKPDEPVKPPVNPVNPSGLKPCPVGFACATVGEQCQDANGTVWYCNPESRTFADGRAPCPGPCWSVNKPLPVPNPTPNPPPKPDPSPTTNVVLVYKLKSLPTSFAGLYMQFYNGMDWITKQIGDGPNQNTVGYRYFPWNIVSMVNLELYLSIQSISILFTKTKRPFYLPKVTK